MVDLYGLAVPCTLLNRLSECKHNVATFNEWRRPHSLFGIRTLFTSLYYIVGLFFKFVSINEFKKQTDINTTIYLITHFNYFSKTQDVTWLFEPQNTRIITYTISKVKC